jgi:hypothetical protein
VKKIQKSGKEQKSDEKGIGVTCFRVFYFFDAGWWYGLAKEGKNNRCMGYRNQ